MRTQRRFAIVVAFVVLTLVGGLGAAGATADEFGRPPEPWMGIDGRMHNHAPLVVEGKPGSGHFFPGFDFDDACYAGERFERGIKVLRSIARSIEKSGRRVIWTVSPNKTSAMPEQLDLATLPHGSCAMEGLAAQEAVLDNIGARDYIPARALIDRSPRQTYWRGDPHWSSVGSSIWVKQVARRLSPRLARQQKWYSTEASFVGLLYAWLGRSDAETAPAVRPRKFVRVQRTKGVDPVAALRSPGPLTQGHIDLAWKTRPAYKAWRGRTLLIGTSMTFFALELMRPLFQRGRFMWLALNDHEHIARAVVKSDTVVLELLQHGAAIYDQIQLPQLRDAIRKALAAAG